MESIDRLRKWWRDRFPVTERQLGCEFRKHVDAIEREVGEMQRALTIDAKPMTDENMAEHGWVRLPVDADGVPIHVGDVMAYADNTKPMEVLALVPPAVFLTENGPRYADMCRHHHAPTVEDLLREFAAEVETAGGVMELPDAALAEYAAKLRLAGDAE